MEVDKASSVDLLSKNKTDTIKDVIKCMKETTIFDNSSYTEKKIIKSKMNKLLIIFPCVTFCFPFSLNRFNYFITRLGIEFTPKLFRN